jgi:hypothetical protein
MQQIKEKEIKLGTVLSCYNASSRRTVLGVVYKREQDYFDNVQYFIKWAGAGLSGFHRIDKFILIDIIDRGHYQVLVA